MASRMSSTNSYNSRVCRCGYGPCIITTSQSTKNPGRQYFKCPRVPPCDKWNGWCDDSIQNTSNVATLAQHNASPNATSESLKKLEDDVATLRAQQLQLIMTVRTLMTILVGVCVVQVALLLRMKFE